MLDTVDAFVAGSAQRIATLQETDHELGVERS